MSRRVPSWWPAVAVPLLAGITMSLYATNSASTTVTQQLAVLPQLPQEATFNAAHSWYNGVALPAVEKDLPRWQRATGEHPAIVSVYTNLTAPFPVAQVAAIIADGAMPLIQINPRGDSLSALLAGRYDGQLAAAATAVAGLHSRVAISFAHEMNGPWTGWGCDHVTPAVFRAAFRYVHTEIGSRDVTWVWNPSHVGRVGMCPLAEWYPGSRYVNWVGLDGYLRRPSSSFGSVFDPTISQVRALAPGKPMLLAEAGVSVSTATPSQIRNLYDGARKAGMIGLVWFDGKTPLGNYEPFINTKFLAAFQRLISK
jgi:Glycosyl hydrolase family 26